MDAAVTHLIAALDGEASASLVRVTALRGFGLRDSGDGAVVHGGDLRGSILGGLADETILAEAATLADGARSAIRATITDRDADAAGMVCGGAAELLLSPVADLPAELGELLQTAQPLALVTAADGSTGDAVVTRKEQHGAPLDEEIVEQARQALAAGATATDDLTVGDTRFVISTIVPRTRCVVVGSGPMAEAIRAQGELMGWTVTIDESVEAGTAFIEAAGPADALVILSHDAAVDVPLLDAALRSPIGYIGGMGSRGTQTRRRTALTELGHDDDAMARIHGPIGLDLGSRTPAETSVAIAAEFLANRSGRVPGRLTDGAGPING